MDNNEDPNLLPSQQFTTAAQLLPLLDRKVIVTLRDDSLFYGFLRSFDQFGNLILQGAVQRVYHENEYAEVELGDYIIRGENVSEIGELDIDKEERILQSLTQTDFERLYQIKADKAAEKEKLSGQDKLKELGYEL